MTDCQYCESDELEVILEYGFNVLGEKVESKEIGTINAVCVECSREQYLTREDLPYEIVRSLIN